MALQGSGSSVPPPGQQAGINLFAAAASGAAASGGGSVYMGADTGGGFVSTAAPTGATGQSTIRPPRLIPESQALDDINYWSSKQQDDFISSAVIGGLLKPGDGVMEMDTLWRQLVKQSAKSTAAGRSLSPWDVLSSYVRTDSKGNLDPWQTSADGRFKTNVLTGEKRYIGPRFETTSQTSTNLTDPTTAKALATSVFQQMMGRDPGQGELAAWGSALNQAEQASPVVTTSTTEFDMNTGAPIASNSTSAGGLSADAKHYLEAQKVKKTPEYGAVQAGTTYGNALENAVYGAPS